MYDPEQKYLEQSRETDLGFILTALNLANQCDLIYKNSKNQRLQVEMALIKMCHVQSAISLANGTVLPKQVTEEDQDKKKTPKYPVKEVNAEHKEVENTPPSPEEAISETNKMDQTQDPEPVPNTDVPSEYFDLPVKDLRQQSSTSIKLEVKPIKKAVPSLIPSLTDLERVAQGALNNEPTYLTGDDKEDFSFEELMEAWNEYAEKAKENGKINIYTLLTTEKPFIEFPPEVIVNLESKYQDDMLREEMVNFMNFLRPKLRNYDINITTRISERKASKKLYTSTEKYQYLVEKNPKLEELRKKFDLELLP
ncbi:MAG: hypothetical protein EOP48_01895 [Sphingobacteriales bacterium]|nr:MAG: hypothetical protein EOP48_01895 [Sphingobacteriales bacterium]